MNLDQALRDAAEPVPARVDQPSARTLLNQIVRSGPVPARAPAPARRLVRRPLLAALAALLALGATWPALRTAPAYASWTPEPRPLAAAAQRDIADRCVARLGPDFPPGPAPARVLGEQRGHYAYLSVVTAAWTTTCFQDEDGSVRDASIFAGPVAADRLGRRGVEMQAWTQLATAEGYCRLMAGHVGTDVVAVDIAIRNRAGRHVRTVRATVEDGYFLAWYPERLDDADSSSTELTLRLTGGGTVAGLDAGRLHDAPSLD